MTALRVIYCAVAVTIVATLLLMFGVAIVVGILWIVQGVARRAF